LDRFDHCWGRRLLARERHPLLDCRAGRALPRMMLVTKRASSCPWLPESSASLRRTPSTA
jgi:hypothetical protein